MGGDWCDESTCEGVAANYGATSQRGRTGVKLSRIYCACPLGSNGPLGGCNAGQPGGCLSRVWPGDATNLVSPAQPLWPARCAAVLRLSNLGPLFRLSACAARLGL